MAIHDEKQAPNSETSPLKHSSDNNVEEDYEEVSVTSAGCGCFPGLWLPWRRNNNRNVFHYHLHHQRQQKQQEEAVVHKEASWLMDKMKKVKEISEVLAGPKWKNFIRRFSKERRVLQFQYDPHSYALNFNDGVLDREAEDGCGHHDFSARFAAPVLL